MTGPAGRELRRMSLRGAVSVARTINQGMSFRNDQLWVANLRRMESSAFDLHMTSVTLGGSVQIGETEMKKTLLATAALVAVLASPALAQSYDPDIGSGNLDSAPYAGNNSAPIHGHARTAARFTPSEAYAHVPDAAFAPAVGSEYRWPKYDAAGVDRNSPGQ
jgi:hypothetical protein